MLHRGYLIGGFASWKYYYLPLTYLLEKQGLIVNLLNPGPFGVNIWPLATFEKEARKVLERESEVFLIGHSLGGIQAVWAASLFPEKVKKIFAIGSPLYGSPWPVYEDGIRTLLDVSPERFDHFRNTIVPSFASRLVTISCPHDIMAPVDKCSVPGAANYIVKTGDDFVATSHLIIPYLSASLSIIQKELGEQGILLLSSEGV